MSLLSANQKVCVKKINALTLKTSFWSRGLKPKLLPGQMRT